MTQENTKQVRFTCRLNSEIYEIIKKNADKNKRSITKEIEYELEKINNSQK